MRSSASKPRLLQRGHVEGRDRLADEAELRLEIVRRLRPVRLVFAYISLRKVCSDLSKTTARCVGLTPGGGILQQLPQHVAEAGDRADRQAIRLTGERRQRVIGAVDVAGAVDQKDVVAGLDRLRRAAWDN